MIKEVSENVSLEYWRNVLCCPVYKVSYGDIAESFKIFKFFA